MAGRLTRLATAGYSLARRTRCYGTAAAPAGFSGAPQSSYTEEFGKALRLPPSEVIPTYRAIDVEGNVLDRDADRLLSDETLAAVWREMLTIRTFDDIMNKLQRQGRFSFFMTESGEESSLFGLGLALKPGDVVFNQYREQALLFHLGKTLRELCSSYMATRGDDMKGRQMPQTMTHNGPVKCVTMKASLGEQIPQAAGSAYALKRAGKKQVVACVFGDGCSSEGDFAVGLNMAASTKAPVLFVARNNGWAISTPADGQQYLGDGVAARGPAYGIPSLRVDGTDLVAMHRACVFAREHCLSSPDAGPFLIEAMTARLGSHSTSDEQTRYRDEAEIERSWKNFDCVEKLRRYMVGSRNLGTAVDAFSKEDATKAVLEAIAAAEKEPPPWLDDLFEDVYAAPDARLTQQRDELKRLMAKWGTNAFGADGRWEWRQ
ncbi:thiamine diphosphate-binding protein [Hyaloraphidium curvatum]|nr:thiamine diphosphate-binding protein [Hyaloraphidium curvatum]